MSDPVRTAAIALLERLDALWPVGSLVRPFGPDWQDEFRALRAALALPVEQPAGWQSIETAPKDGAWILGYGKEMVITDYPAVVFWDDGWQSVNTTRAFHLSHWMPLPASPSTTEPKDSTPLPCSCRMTEVGWYMGDCPTHSKPI